MSPDAINVAISEECGWEIQKISGRITNLGWKTVDEDEQSTPFPSYFSDLNACAEMEATLTDEEYALFKKHLCDAIGSGFRIVSATAPQRCEAFLRVKGKWIE